MRVNAAEYFMVVIVGLRVVEILVESKEFILVFIRYGRQNEAVYVAREWQEWDHPCRATGALRGAPILNDTKSIVSDVPDVKMDMRFGDVRRQQVRSDRLAIRAGELKYWEEHTSQCILPDQLQLARAVEEGGGEGESEGGEAFVRIRRELTLIFDMRRRRGAYIYVAGTQDAARCASPPLDLWFSKPVTLPPSRTPFVRLRIVCCLPTTDHSSGSAVEICEGVGRSENRLRCPQAVHSGHRGRMASSQAHNFALHLDNGAEGDIEEVVSDFIGRIVEQDRGRCNTHEAFAKTEPGLPCSPEGVATGGHQYSPSRVPMHGPGGVEHKHARGSDVWDGVQEYRRDAVASSNGMRSGGGQEATAVQSCSDSAISDGRLPPRVPFLLSVLSRRVRGVLLALAPHPQVFTNPNTWTSGLTTDVTRQLETRFVRRVDSPSQTPQLRVGLIDELVDRVRTCWAKEGDVRTGLGSWSLADGEAKLENLRDMLYVAVGWKPPSTEHALDPPTVLTRIVANYVQDRHLKVGWRVPNARSGGSAGSMRSSTSDDRETGRQ
ncbi:hypothetical protein FA13DRAFT_1712277 [Coprinellus micaceus]|uniref:Uncharacterized protein n=1 Tax=Coprinellus micaceus TaxID=71717 RepID=A0A4Y7T0R7_COPMI|nr:hypothetical protein FA13DRAFT_1712277 [Coprinellus micaceus]